MDLEEGDMETISYIYEHTINEAVPKQMRFLSSDITIKKNPLRPIIRTKATILHW
jgi:hypothetical protein